MKYLNRFLFYILGLFALALASILAVKSNLGVSPVTSIQFALSQVTDVSLGIATIILYSIYIILQIIILKKDFQKIQLLQLFFAIFFGQVVNFLNTTINIDLQNLIIRLIVCITSLFITAIGVFLTITANIVPVSPDALTKAISIKKNVEFGKTKIYFDCIIVSIALLILIVFKKSIQGIGFGTLLSAIFVGRIVHFLNIKFKHNIEKIIFEQKNIDNVYSIN